MCGDVLLTAAFVSYVGSFPKLYRQELIQRLWLPFLKSQKVRLFQCKTVAWYENLFSMGFYENAILLREVLLFVIQAFIYKETVEHNVADCSFSF